MAITMRHRATWSVLLEIVEPNVRGRPTADRPGQKPDRSRRALGSPPTAATAARTAPRAIGVGHQGCFCSDRFEGDGQHNGARRSIGFRGGRIGGGNKKSRHDGGVLARRGQISGRLCQMAGTKRTVEWLARDQSARSRIAANDGFNLSQRRGDQ